MGTAVMVTSGKGGTGKTSLTAGVASCLAALGRRVLPVPPFPDVTMKSVGSDGEIEAALPAVQLLGGRVEQRFDYTIPGAGVAHRVVVVEKTGPTPMRYPRRWAKMQKAPL